MSEAQQCDLEWKLCQALYHGPGKVEAKGAWHQATVPGAIQLDIARGTDYEDYAFGENWQRYRWMEKEYFLYRATFADPRDRANEVCRFMAAGIDYQFEIILNGTLLHQQEGMFKPVDLILNDCLQGKNTLEIVVFPPPTGGFAEVDRRQASRSAKPAVSYGWDWHPRLIPSGIWDEAQLRVCPVSHLNAVSWQVDLSPDYRHGHLRAEVTGHALNGCRINLRVQDPSASEIMQKSVDLSADEALLEVTIDDPELWWPHDHGSPSRYEVQIDLIDAQGTVADQHVRKLGFRRVALTMNEGAWNQPDGFPKGRSPAPITLTINGRRIFSKGTNWVNPDIFPGRIKADDYHSLLELAKGAHFNLLRIWGGGIVNKAAFHELCDEMGLMVWQEFPLACNNYPDEPAYLEVLESEARAIITRLRQHPSTVMWCGGNELFNRWSGMTDQSKALRLLNSLCLELDPDVPYLMTSPIFGMAHGHYVLRDDDSGEEVFSWMARAQNTAYTEYGVSGPADVEILQQIIPEDELWPPEPGTSWESHHAFRAWRWDTWLRKDMLAHYFGPAKNLAELVGQGQYLQGLGLRFIYEEARRQKPLCSMALNWCFNEPWPTAANSSIISYPARPKPAYFEVQAACRPLALAARFEKLVWQTGEYFECDLHFLNDHIDAVDAGQVLVEFIQAEDQVHILTWDHPALEANQNLLGPRCRFKIPNWSSDHLILRLRHQSMPECSSTYPLLLAYSGERTRFYELNQ